LVVIAWTGDAPEWVKEDIYGSQTRPISRYKAAVEVDNKVHVQA